MRYALVADIHGNREALDAVLQAVDRQHPGIEILCAGDIVGYGPDPAACLEILRERGISCVRGNHEEMVAGLRDFSRCVSAGIRAATWTRRQLGPEQLRFLRELPICRPITPQLWMCHGDLHSADVYVSDHVAAEGALQQLRAVAPDAQVLVCGHTHHAAIYASEGGFRVYAEPGCVALAGGPVHVVNPGAVGQSRDGVPMARFAVLDVEQRTLTFERLAYDHAQTETKMRRAGLHGGTVLLPPTGLQRRIERARTRWARYWGDRDNRQRGYTQFLKP